MAPPPAAGAPPPPTGVLTKLQALGLGSTQITDAGCAALAAALDGGVLPALKSLYLRDTPASNAAWARWLAWPGGGPPVAPVRRAGLKVLP